MKIYVMDAFAAKLFGGNQAGVALPEGDVSDETMRLIAAELKHSETAFVRPQEDGSVDLRYFTPAGEVELCGHATIAAFALLRRLGRLSDGRHIARTKAGELQISVDGDVVWMDMAPPRWLGELTRVEWEPLYRAFGLTGAGPDAPDRVHGPGGYHDAGAGPGDAAAGPAERDAGGGAVPAAEGHGGAHVLPGGRHLHRLVQQFRPAV